ncbi:MAG: PEGA domain-containing protein [Planctomycetota bacterium]|nr:MAG: PEGA domain-containing protein [Planctomycetota bacterium]
MCRTVLFLLAALVLFALPVLAADGKLYVKSNVKGKVYLNGVKIGETGKVLEGLPLGKVKLRIVAEGYVTHEEEIKLADEMVVNVKVNLKKSGETSPKKTASKPTPTPPKKPDTGPDTGPGDVAGKPDKPKPTEQKPGGKEEEKKQAEDKSAKVDEKTVREVSKAGDALRLKEILNGKSEYKVKLIAASALLRLKSTDGFDAIEREIDRKFNRAPKDFFSSSPFIEKNRKAVATASVKIIARTKAAKIDTVEEAAAAYLVFLELSKRLEKKLAQVEKLTKRVEDRKKGGRGGMFREVHKRTQQKEQAEKEATGIRESVNVMIALLKKGSRSKDKDLEVLIKRILKRAEELMNPDK